MNEQKTITVRGKRYTGKQVSKLLDKNNMTNGDDYIVHLNGEKYYANYREIQDDHYAPVCNAGRANAISLMPDGTYAWSIWLTL